jgi:hypothetical protein
MLEVTADTVRFPDIFLGFLPVAIGLIFLSPRRYSNIAITILSLVFYTWGEPKFALIVVASAAFDWTVAFPRYKSDYLHIDLEETSRLQAVPSISFVGGRFTRGMIAFLVSVRTANVTFIYLLLPPGQGRVAPSRRASCTSSRSKPRLCRGVPLV